MGIMTKLSWDCPKTLPNVLATPTISYGLPSMAMVLPSGSCGFEEARADVVADEGHGRVAAHLFVGDAAAGIHLHVVDGGNVVGDAIDLDALHRIALEGDARVARGHHADVFEQGGLAPDELELVGLDLRVAFLHLEEFLGIPGTEPRHAHDAEAVGAHVGDLFGDVDVHAVDQGGDGDQGGGGEDDSQQRQEAPELVLAERIEGDAGGLPEGGAEAELAGAGDSHLTLETRGGRCCSGKCRGRIVACGGLVTRPNRLGATGLTRRFRHRRRHLLFGESRQHLVAIGHVPDGGRNHGGGLAGVLGDDALVGIEVGVPGVALVFDGVLLQPDAGQARVVERGAVGAAHGAARGGHGSRHAQVLERRQRRAHHRRGLGRAEDAGAAHAAGSRIDVEVGHQLGVLRLGGPRTFRSAV